MLLDFLKVNCSIQHVQLDIQSVLTQLASIYARLLVRTIEGFYTGLLWDNNVTVVLWC